MQPIYLDYNATTPIDPRVAEAMMPYIREHFGNPSSSHSFGAQARQAVEAARNQVADLLQCRVDEIIFTSGGTESNNFAIKGIAGAYREKGNHIITSQIEHPAVLEVCRKLEKSGYRLTYLPVDGNGLVNPEDVAASITPTTILVSIMHSNNEVGTLQPIVEISKICRDRGVIFHTDCAQSIGKVPVSLLALEVDLLSVAGHKLYAPKGVGALYVRTGVKLEKLIDGADHELNRRAGTENVMQVVALGKACELVGENIPEASVLLEELRDRLQNLLQSEFPNARINGHPEHRLPNTLSISFPNMEANTIVSELTGVAVSAGAACHSDRVDVSHVLEAMRVPRQAAMGTLRISVGRFTTPDEVDRAASEITEVVKRLQPSEPAVTADMPAKRVKLTRYTHGLGCACKLRPQVLEEVLRKMPVVTDSNVLVGTESADDAAVYRLNNNIAIVQTVDFFTPVVDDPYSFGAIAAANSLSDIYAMGAQPLFALNIVGFPTGRLPVEVLEEILRGAGDKGSEAGISTIGGHTIDDTEPKFGLAVTGIASPHRILTNRKARSGDRLILTKPIGTGILATALKQGVLKNKETADLIACMTELNKQAAEAMAEFEVSACTDVTGFGLIGHLLEMVRGSGISARLYSGNVPALPGSYEYCSGGYLPGGSRNNFEYTSEWVRYDSNISETQKFLLNDAQTSGGLMIAVQSREAENLLDSLKEKGVSGAVVIGEFFDGDEPGIEVI